MSAARAHGGGSLLAVRGVHKSFGGVQVLRGLDLEIAPGEIRCLIGPNGSGKSTLLKSIVGLNPPSAGRIELAGRRIDGLRSFAIIRAGISIKFQVLRIFRELTVYQNLRIPCQRPWARIADPAAEINRLMALVGLAGLGHVVAGTLSHGQQQWLEIGMAIAGQPRLLLLDEPTAGMTLDERSQTAELVLRLNREAGVGVIVVEHDMSFVRHVDRKVSVLHQGQIFFEGSLDAVQASVDIQRIYFGERRD